MRYCALLVTMYAATLGTSSGNEDQFLHVRLMYALCTAAQGVSAYCIQTRSKRNLFIPGPSTLYRFCGSTTTLVLVPYRNNHRSSKDFFTLGLCVTAALYQGHATPFVGGFVPRMSLAYELCLVLKSTYGFPFPGTRSVDNSTRR